jgi:aromatic-amino-acid transaminase
MSFVIAPAGVPVPHRQHLTVFGALRPVDSDPVFAINDEFRGDMRAPKANLGIGVYCDEQGRVPVLASVQSAAQALAKESHGGGYLPVEGFEPLARGVQALLLGADHEAVSSRRIATLQTVGGSGALRLAGEFLRNELQVPGVWVSDPSWHNHRVLFEGAGLRVESYPYFDPVTGGLRFDELKAALGRIPERGVVLLQACCHNPTGVDLTPAQWMEVTEILSRRNLIPFIDLAYQGFGQGLDEDAFAVRCLADAGIEFLVAQSFSKNFSLYGERCGTLSIVATSSREARQAMQHMKAIVSRFYFSPPAHGARAAAKVLHTPVLARQWMVELAVMRERVETIRRRLHEELISRQAEAKWDRVALTHGMFVCTGLTREQVSWLKLRHGVYLAPNGRLCIAALNQANLLHVAEALVDTHARIHVS